MSDGRIFVRTSHGALHRPSCRNLAKLVGETTDVVMEPEHLWGWRFGARMAACCSSYGRARQTVAYEWAEYVSDVASMTRANDE